ncbi:MAG: M3 family oligoendopeptidase [Planctomycetota bacterium]|nr:M3 family oligoendopeptidase [Planctomycetota bacterium]
MTESKPFVTAELDATKWDNLEPLYQSLVDRELRCEGCLEKLLLDRSELDALVSEAGANLYITMTRHTDDEAANRGYEQFVQEVSPRHKQVSFELDKKICDSPHAEKLDPDRYGVMLRETRTSVGMFREENIPIQTELALLEQKYNQIVGAMTCEFEGETRTMPQMALYLEDQDRELRERAWRTVADRRMQDREALDELFDEMAAKRGAIGSNAGFENFRDYQHAAMMRYDYTPGDCARFHEAIEQVVVPLRRKLDEERREALGIDRLRPWDAAVDTRGRDPLRPFKDADQLVDRSSKVFNRMDSELGAMFDRLREGDCLDLETRQNKAPGGYQYNRDFSRMPFIFMNAAGLHRDLETMVHEAGHAFHSFLADHDPLVGYRHSPIEFAEVASMSMELLTYPYLEEFYTEVDANRARREHLEAMSRTLSWIAQVDAFQHWLYLNPGHGVEERSRKWVELDERFGGGTDWEGLEAQRMNLWHRQLHIFGMPFYYIEYGIAQLGALQVWLNSKRKGEREAIGAYKKALALGGSKPLPQLFETAECRFDFGSEIVGELMDAVRDELETIPA